MKRFGLAFTAQLLATHLGGELLERHGGSYNCVGEFNEAGASCACFLQDTKYLEAAKSSEAGLIVVPEGFDAELLPKPDLVFASQPYLQYMLLVRYWVEQEKPAVTAGIHPSAVVHSRAIVDNTAVIGPGCVIEANSVVGANTRLVANCYVGAGCIIGHNCHLNPNVTLYADTVLGNRVVLHSGVVLGADGFGYIQHQGHQHKIPQVGNVHIEDDVEIGANSCVDRSTLGVTRIQAGSKIDNLVQVGHNCKVGPDSILCAQVGLAGGTTLGRLVYMGGQSGTAGHLHLADKTMVGAQSGVVSTSKEESRLFGSPAMDATTAMRLNVALKKLGDWHRELIALAKKQRENK